VQDAVEDDGRRGAGEGPLTGGHLVKHSPEPEQVGARYDQLAPRLLRRHVGHGARAVLGLVPVLGINRDRRRIL